MINELYVIIRRDEALKELERQQKLISEGQLFGNSRLYQEGAHVREEILAIDQAEIETGDLEAQLDMREHMACDGCGVISEKLIHVGEPIDYDTRWVEICESCLKAAIAKLQGE